MENHKSEKNAKAIQIICRMHNKHIIHRKWEHIKSKWLSITGKSMWCFVWLMTYFWQRKIRFKPENVFSQSEFSLKNSNMSIHVALYFDVMTILLFISNKLCETHLFWKVFPSDYLLVIKLMFSHEWIK